MIRRPEDAVDDKGRTIPAPHTVGEPLPQEPASSAPSVVVLDYGAVSYTHLTLPTTPYV